MNDHRNALTCYWCSSPVRWGVRVCLGCNADVVYRMTKRERNWTVKFGFLIGVLIDLALVIPALFTPRGQPPVGAGTCLLLPPALVFLVTWLRARWLRGKPRFFRITAL